MGARQSGRRPGSAPTASPLIPGDLSSIQPVCRPPDPPPPHAEPSQTHPCTNAPEAGEVGGADRPGVRQPFLEEQAAGRRRRRGIGVKRDPLLVRPPRHPARRPQLRRRHPRRALILQGDAPAPHGAIKLIPARDEGVGAGRQSESPHPRGALPADRGQPRP